MNTNKDNVQIFYGKENLKSLCEEILKNKFIQLIQEEKWGAIGYESRKI